MRVLRVMTIVAGGCLAGLAPLGSAAENERPPPPDRPEIRLFDFSLPASDGYRLDFFAAGEDGSPELAALTVTKKNGSATYIQPRVDVLTERRVVADFGSFGTVRVKFRSQGRDGDGRGCSPFNEIEGTFRGTIRFRGEDGFTSADATRARGAVTTLAIPDRDCEQGRALRRPEPVFLGSCSQDGRSEYLAIKDERSDFAFHQATRTERRAGLTILRSAFAQGSVGTFTTKGDLSAAEVNPGGRFTGSATYSSGELSGDLSAPVPGTVEPLALTPGEATLKRGIQGFRPPCGRTQPLLAEVPSGLRHPGSARSAHALLSGE